MNLPRALVVLAALAYIVYLTLSRRRVDFAQFATAGKTAGPWLTFASLAATFVGPAMTMGLVRAGYQVGYLYIPFAFLAGANALILSKILAAPLRRKFAQARSIGEVIGGPDGHDSQSVRQLIGVIGFALTTAICIVMSKAGGELLNHIFGLPLHWGILIATGIVTAYASRGGIRATMQTDAAQLVGFCILVPLLGFLMVSSEAFSFSEWTRSSIELANTHSSKLTGAALLSLFVFWFLGSGFDPTYVARLLASRSPQIASLSLRCNGLFIIVWMSLMYLIGSIGFSLDPNLPVNDQLLLNFGQSHYGELLYGLFIVAMIGVVMSSQDSMLNSASVLLANDIISPLHPKLSDRNKLRIATWGTLFIGCISAAVALAVDSILQAIIFIWSVYTPAIAPSLLASVYLKKPRPLSAIVSIFSGLLTSSSIVLLGLSTQFPAVLFGLAASVSAYAIARKWQSSRPEAIPDTAALETQPGER